MRTMASLGMSVENARVTVVFGHGLDALVGEVISYGDGCFELVDTKGRHHIVSDAAVAYVRFEEEEP